MSRFTVLMTLGILVALSPYIGLPLSTLAIILPLLGLSIAAMALALRMRARERVRQEAVPTPSYDVQEA